jgi:hypothetical protein
VSLGTVVVEHASLVFSHLRPLSYAQNPSNMLKLSGTTACLIPDHVVEIQDGQCLYNQKTRPTTP